MKRVTVIVRVSDPKSSPDKQTIEHGLSFDAQDETAEGIMSALRAWFIRKDPNRA